MAGVVFVDLWHAGSEVEERGEPGEDAAGDLCRGGCRGDERLSGCDGGGEGRGVCYDCAQNGEYKESLL